MLEFIGRLIVVPLATVFFLIAFSAGLSISIQAISRIFVVLFVLLVGSREHKNKGSRRR
jgi:hypothetical protein